MGQERVGRIVLGIGVVVDPRACGDEAVGAGDGIEKLAGVEVDHPVLAAEHGAVRIHVLVFHDPRPRNGADVLVRFAEQDPCVEPLGAHTVDCAVQIAECPVHAVPGAVRLAGVQVASGSVLFNGAEHAVELFLECASPRTWGARPQAPSRVACGHRCRLRAP